MNLNLKPIVNKDIIILDDGFSNLTFKEESYETINFNSINIFCAIKTLGKYFFSKDSLNIKETYKQTLYRMYSPKLAISHHINKRGIECKYLCPEIKTVIYQFGYCRNLKMKDVLGRFKNLNIKDPIDFFFCYHNEDKISLNFDKSKISIIGSLKNNEIREKKIKKDKNSLLYISEFNPNFPYSKKYYKTEEKFIKIIHEFCKSNNKKFNIALRSNRKDKNLRQLNEIDYYKKMIGNNFGISSKDSYNFAFQNELVVCISSNLGFELLSRGKKILFVLLKEAEGGIYPYLPKKDKIFLERSIDKKKIFFKLQKIFNLKQKDWLNTISLKKNKIIFDSGNILFKKQVKKIIKN